MTATLLRAVRGMPPFAPPSHLASTGEPASAPCATTRCHVRDDPRVQQYTAARRLPAWCSGSGCASARGPTVSATASRCGHHHHKHATVGAQEPRAFGRSAASPWSELIAEKDHGGGHGGGAGRERWIYHRGWFSLTNTIGAGRPVEGAARRRRCR